MYLPESGVGELGRFLNAAFDATQGDNTSLNAEYLKDGYAFFESINTEKERGCCFTATFKPCIF